PDEDDQSAKAEDSDEQQSHAGQNHVGQAPCAVLPHPILGEFERPRETSDLVAGQIDLKTIVRAAHVARVAGFGLPDKAIVLARLPLLRMLLLQIEISDLIATLPYGLLGQPARLLRRGRGPRGILVHVVM